MNTLKIGSRGDEVKHLQKHLNLVSDGIFGKLTEEVVKKFQKDHNLVADGIVGERTWEMICECKPAALITNGKIVKTSRKINRIILHCTATPEGKDFTVDRIREMHLQRGFSDIGYHYLIYRNGRIVRGRDINKVGSHCAGYNTGSIGIAYVGGVAKDGKTAKDTRTPEQRQALKELVSSLRIKYSGATVHGHNEFSSKACPSFNVQKDL